jgi:4-hydroxy-tetrahydrodipicolinate synthase
MPLVEKGTAAMPAPFRGVFTALVTPMTPDEELDLGALAAHVERQIGDGVHGLVALGSTGEYYALSPAEREAVARTVVEAARSRVPVLAGPNAGATRDAVAFARQAEKAGAAGLLVSAPYYSLPSPDELVEHVRAVAGATPLPVVLYNYPGRTGVDMTPEVAAAVDLVSGQTFAAGRPALLPPLTTRVLYLGETR